MPRLTNPFAQPSPSYNDGDFSRRPSRKEQTKAQVLYAPIFDGRLPRPILTGEWLSKVRNMRRDPTIGFARDLVLAPFLAASWTMEVDADPDWTNEEVELAEHVSDFQLGQMNKVRTRLLRSAVLGMVDFGWQGFEKVYGPHRDEKLKETLIGVRKLKPLLQDFTEIVVDDYGNFVGLFNNPIVIAIGEPSRPGRTSMVGEIQLGTGECAIFSRAVEGTNWYGEPMMRRVEDAYDRWEECDGAAERYFNKLAGAHWVVHYPLGKSEVNGEELDNFEIANRILNNLQASGKVAIPRQIAAFVDDMNNQDSGDAWHIEILAAQGSPSATFTDREKYLDTLKVRGLNLPERAVLEGQYGTKAEAEAHADFAIELSEMWHAEIVKEINEQVNDEMTEINLGKRFRGRLRLATSPLSDSKKAVLQQLYTSLIANPDGMLEEIDRVDWDAVRSKLGIPTVSLSDEEEEELEQKRDQLKEKLAQQAQQQQGGDPQGEGQGDPQGEVPLLEPPSRDDEEEEPALVASLNGRGDPWEETYSQWGD